MGLAAVATTHSFMILRKTPEFSFKNQANLFGKQLVFYSPNSLTHFKSLLCLRVNSLHSKSPFIRTHHPIQELFLLLTFSLTLLCFRLLSNALLPDFPLRWQRLIAFSREAETRTKSYPKHLWQAIVAYEDRRFFRHFGIDPVGIGRAVMSLSARGGGSTITQQIYSVRTVESWVGTDCQMLLYNAGTYVVPVLVYSVRVRLVKNTFLKNERTFSRKILETVLALVLERTMSKQRILSSYVCKIYWGHGINGIESASKFYFGKHPSLLSLAESAMLTGLIPAPELRSPLRDHTSGKTFQARVLKRMVQVGFLNIETALLTVRQPLFLHLRREEHADELGVGEKNQHTEEGRESTWDWERESKIREVCEEMERWAIKVRLSNS